MQMADMSSEKEEVSQIEHHSLLSSIFLNLVRKNCASSREGREGCQSEKMKSFEEETNAKEKPVESDGDQGNDEMTGKEDKEDKRRRKEQERKKSKEQIRLRKEERKLGEEENKRAKREER